MKKVSKFFRVLSELDKRAKHEEIWFNLMSKLSSKKEQKKKMQHKQEKQKQPLRSVFSGYTCTHIEYTSLELGPLFTPFPGTTQMKLEPHIGLLVL